MKSAEAWLFVNPNSGNSHPTKRIDELWVMTSSPVKFHEAKQHSYATRMAKILLVQIVQVLLGHSQSIMRYYAGDIKMV
jgi:integrase